MHRPTPIALQGSRKGFFPHLLASLPSVLLLSLLAGLFPEPVTAERITLDLQALYTFDEGSGAVIADTAGSGAPLDLTIADLNNVTWNEGFLNVNAPTIISSLAPASRLIEAVSATHEITLEAWISSADLNQNGPARILSLSTNPQSRNFTLGQGVFASSGDRLEIRLRSTATSTNGTPATRTDSESLTLGLQHVVYTRDALGNATVYLNGEASASQVVAGDLSNWSPSMALLLANEADGSRPWLGEYHLVAFYNRALTPLEVSQNFAEGPEGTNVGRPQAALTALPASGQAPLAVTLDGSGSTDDDGIVSYQWDFGDGASETTSEPTSSHTYAAGSYTATLTVRDAQGATATATAAVTVSGGPRATADLQALYQFTANAGNTVYDVSGSATALDLTIPDLSAVRWLPGGGLSIESPTQIVSTQPTTALNQAIADSGEVTLEAWITPANLTQNGPARIVTLSSSPTLRNLTLAQGVYSAGADRLEIRLRSTATSNNGQPATQTNPGTLTTDLTHVVYTRDRFGAVQVYLNGVLTTGGTTAGDLSNWDLGYALALGEEFNSTSRAWLGEYHLVALYSRALSAAEVTQNFAAGSPGGTGGTPNDPPLASLTATPATGPAPLLVTLDGAGSSDDKGIISYQWDFGDGATTTTTQPITSHTYAAGSYTANLTVRDAEGASDTATTTITATAANGTPTASDDSYTLNEDTDLSVSGAEGTLANDTDNNPPDDLIAVLVTNPTAGTLTSFTSEGAFTYMPNPNVNGLDSFTYNAVDADTGATASATVRLTVNPRNDPPVANDDSVAVAFNTASNLTIASALLANDSDVDGDTLALGSFTQPATGTLVDTGNGVLIYTPDAGFNGTDSFTYSASDGSVASNLATVTVNAAVGNTAPHIMTGSLVFTKQLIAQNMDETHSVVAADFDGDGDIDAAATDYVDGQVVWFENDGSGTFTQQILDPSLDGAYPSHTADVDGDGDNDVLAGGYLADTFVWYQNNGSGGFTRQDIDTAANGAHSIVSGDLDQDGDLDLITSSQDAGTVSWYENDGSQLFIKHLIDDSADRAKRATFADIDNDGDLDVVSASFANDEIAWQQNDGNQNFTKRVIDTTADGAYFVFTSDLDGDGNVDILSASQNDATIAWYQNDGNGNFVKQVIDSNAKGARSVIAADVDGDGDDDALAASVDDDTVAWYINDGNGGFSKRLLDIDADGAYGVFATDMDGDGDIDVLSASRDANAVAVYRQLKAHAALLAPGDSLVINNQLLMTTDLDNAPETLTYTLTEAPSFGELDLDGAVLANDATFSQADIDNNRLRYTHDGGQTPFDTFTFAVTDGIVEPAAGTFTLSIGYPDDTLVLLPLDEGGGTVAEDASGAGNDGFLLNGPLFQADTPDASPFALDLDGVDDFIDLGSLDVNGNGLTLAAWFNADSFPGSARDPRLLSKAFSTAANDHIFMLGTIQVGSATRLRGRVRVGGVTTTVIGSFGNLLTNVWQHAALTYDGSRVRLYLNGIEVASEPLAGAVDQDLTMAVTAASQPAGAGERFFDGLLDDVRILQRPLSPAEIAAIVAKAVPH